MKSGKYFALLLIILLVSNLLYGEIISEGSSIRELYYAKNLDRTGFESSYSFEYLKNKQNSTLYSNNHFINFTYGFIDGFNFILKVPFYKRYYNEKISQSGLGDTFIALKYNINNSDFSSFEHSFITSISLPTGNDEENSNFSSTLSLKKKEYQIMYLMDYKKDYFSIHTNIAFSTLDNFQLEKHGDMHFSYKFGAIYKLYTILENNLWIKWEFITNHSLYSDENNPREIEGSQYLALSQNLPFGLSFEAGVISELYKSDALGFRVGLSYSAKGDKLEREKKLFEKYGENINLGLIEFLNEDTTKTLGTVSSVVKEDCIKANGILLNYYNKEQFNLFKNYNKINNTENGGVTFQDSLIMQGKIVKSGFERSSFFFIPLFINFPKISYNIDIEVLVYDTNKNKVIFHKTVSDEASIGQGVKFFNLNKDRKNYFLSASEEMKLQKECTNRIAKKVLKNLSSKFE